MGIAIGSILKGAIEPLSDIVNKAVKDKDLALKINRDILQKMIEVDVSHTKEVASIIRAEANSESWLTRSWRPIAILFFVFCIGSYWFGFAPPYLVENPDVVNEVFGIIKLALGGYVMGRSVEKTVKTVAENGGIKKVLG